MLLPTVSELDENGGICFFDPNLPEPRSCPGGERRWFVASQYRFKSFNRPEPIFVQTSAIQLLLDKSKSQVRFVSNRDSDRRELIAGDLALKSRLGVGRDNQVGRHIDASLHNHPLV